MTRAFRLRRILFATLILTAIASTFPAGQASAVTTSGRTRLTAVTGTTDTLCRVDWRLGPEHVKKLIRCVAAYYHVNADMALYVAHRESRFNPKAYNAWSCAKGIYQHLCRYWPERSLDYGFRSWSAYNARANIFVTIKMVKRYGWRPWGL